MCYYSLKAASENGNIEVVKNLLSLYEYRDEDYVMAFIFSAENNHVEIMKYIVSLGINIDDKILTTALRHAAIYSHPEVIKYLITLGVEGKEFALRYSSEKGCLESVKYLVNSGADIYAQDDEPLKNSIDYRHIEVSKFLISVGANIQT